MILLKYFKIFKVNSHTFYRHYFNVNAIVFNYENHATSYVYYNDLLYYIISKMDIYHSSQWCEKLLLAFIKHNITDIFCYESNL